MPPTCRAPPPQSRPCWRPSGTRATPPIARFLRDVDGVDLEPARFRLTARRDRSRPRRPAAGARGRLRAHDPQPGGLPPPPARGRLGAGGRARRRDRRAHPARRRGGRLRAVRQGRLPVERADADRAGPGRRRAAHRPGQRRRPGDGRDPGVRSSRPRHGRRDRDLARLGHRRRRRVGASAPRRSCPSTSSPGRAGRTSRRRSGSCRTASASTSTPGPSETLVLALDDADPRLVAVDVLSEAEHGPDSHAYAVCADPVLAEAVAAALTELAARAAGRAPRVPRRAARPRGAARSWSPPTA